MYLAPLTSLRFFAAALVFASHLAFLHKSDSNALGVFYAHVLSRGFIGVTFFFILSGFILSHSYGADGGARTADWRGFMAGRVARIYPLHLLTLLFAVPMTVWNHHDRALLPLLPEAVANAALLHAFIPLGQGILNSPAWSLSAEMFFYAMFPLLLRQRSRVLLGLFVLTAVFQWGAVRLGQKDPLAQYLVYVFPCSRIGDFIVGMLLYRVYTRFPVVPARLATGLQVGAVALLVLFFANKWGRFSISHLDIYYVTPLAAIVLAFAWSNGALAQKLSGRTMVFLGQSSFALYMLHFPLIYYGQTVRIHVIDAPGAAADMVFSIVYFALCVALSGLLFVFYEGPMQKRVLLWLRRRPAPQPATTRSPERQTSPAALS
ncbi:MAG: acyltransferase [Haliea sp.]|nr:MAG: acyltransferase [Haliea sp.]